MTTYDMTKPEISFYMYKQLSPNRWGVCGDRRDFAPRFSGKRSEFMHMADSTKPMELALETELPGAEVGDHLIFSADGEQRTLEIEEILHTEKLPPNHRDYTCLPYFVANGKCV